MKFVIIGGDAAGMSAASRAKRKNPDLEVTVFEQSQDVSYSACGMPYNIADPERAMGDLVVRQAEVFRQKQGLDLRTGHQVTSIEPAKQRVRGVTSEGAPFEAAYDRLLIATGGRAIIPDLPGFDLPGVLALKSLADGRAIKSYLEAHEVKRAVIIGMGYIGLEMCEAFRARGIEVAMVKPNPVFLPRFDGTLSNAIREMLLEKGITLHAGRAVEAITAAERSRAVEIVAADGRDQAVEALQAAGQGLIVNGDGLSLATDLVLVAIGLKPNSGLAVAAGLETGPGGAIAVDRSLRTSAEHIYAAGDCADGYHVVTGEKTWVPLALRANRAGWAVADQVTGTDTVLPGIAGTAVFKVFDHEVARTGLTVKEAEQNGFSPRAVTVKARSRAHAHPGASTILVHLVGDAASGRLLGCQMVGVEGVAHRINAAAVALHAGMTVAAFSQADLAYAPPFGPVWDPLLTAANQLLKKL